MFRFKHCLGKVLLLALVLCTLGFVAEPLISALADRIAWWYVNWTLFSSYSAAFILLVLIGSFVCAFCPRLGKRKRCVADDGWEKESPIECQNNDLLHRRAFVCMLHELLSGTPVDGNNNAIGLYGQWGSGKTSVVNLLKEFSLETDQGSNLIFVDFAPWKYATQDDLPSRFFLHVADSVRRKLGFFSRDAQNFTRLARALRLKYEVQRIGTLNSIVDWAQSLWMSVFCNEKDLRNELITCLAESDKRIIVVVDDLDRLPNEDVCRFISFLKSHADLPGLLFLIVADETRLAEAIGDIFSGGDKTTEKRTGRLYLEKIISVSRTLPPINHDELVRLAKNKIARLVERALPGDLGRENLDLDVCAPYMRDVRCVKRLVNAIRIDLTLAIKRIGRRKIFPYDLGDFVAVSVFREFERDFYQDLPKTRAELDKATPFFMPDKDGLSQRWMNEHVYSYVTPEGRDVCEKFLRERVGVFEMQAEHDTVYRLSSHDDSHALLGFRLSSRFYFNSYMMIDSECDLINEDVVNEFIEGVRRGEYPQRIIDGLDKDGVLPLYLYVIEGLPLFKEEKTSLFYLHVLAKLSNEHLSDARIGDEIKTGEMFPLGVYERVFRAFYRYVEAFRKVNDGVGDEILHVLEEERAAYLMCEFIAVECKKHESATADFDSIFTNDQYGMLEHVYLKLIAELQVNDYVTNHLACFDLLRCWLLTLRKYESEEVIQGFTRSNEHCLTDYHALSKILVFFSFDQRAAQDDANALSVEIDKMEKFWTSDQIDTIAKTLTNCTHKNERDKLFLLCLNFVLDAKRAGKDYSRDAQLKYLHELKSS